MSRRPQEFGGPWTDDKLERLGNYLDFYVTVMKKQAFELVYIDAFAGTGYRQESKDHSEISDMFDREGMDQLAKGSARVALEVNPPFKRYVFIDAKKSVIEALREVEEEFPVLRDRMIFRCGDANEELVKLCRETDWRKTRAVAFLDPFAMQVNWSTIEAIAATGSVDLWYLFPYMAVNRVMEGAGHIQLKWQEALDRVLPSSDWRQVFYKPSPQESFDFIEESELVKDASVNRMERYILAHMKKIFAGVAENSLPLLNSRHQCLFLLTFACGSTTGAPIALRGAEHILKLQSYRR